MPRLIKYIENLKQTLVEYDTEKAVELTDKALSEGASARFLISEAILPATKIIGEKYETGEYFLSELVLCGETLQAVMKPILEHLGKEVGKKEEEIGKIVLATVEGDIHDIGKNIVRLFLQGSGFTVEDMGVDMPAGKIIDKAVDVKADIIALSCLMSVTRDHVKDVVEELEKRGLRKDFKILVGGRSTNEKWAGQIGCDKWAADGPGAVEAARSLVGRGG
ncbi:cobalamin B12-binding domain-containing protein [Candidatus Hecatella orcuttiae]|uniref:cobalamin B12-binding domain-containing protein n=1 Tax=Candidatus Hecatella orcuttiae TaxID=1935119 RepID=UPI0028682B92|nr:cobalamin-dependent protein [Candidatus Hecatella orcuttiae]